VEQYVHKGDKLYIEGRLRYTTYDDNKGQRRYVTEIWAENMEMLTPKSSAQLQADGAADTASAADKPGVF
jgi:single-strand DNA-binding protein